MKRSLTNVCDIHAYLSNTVLFNIPSNGLGTLECSRTHNGIPVLIKAWLTGNRISLAHRTPLFTDIKSNGIGTTRGSGIQIKVDSN